MRTFVLFIMSLAFAVAQEPSAFNAGDLSSKSPYGLSSTEKYIFNNKKKLDRLSLKISKLQEKLKTVSDLFLDTTDKMQQDIFSINKKIQLVEARVASEVFSIKQNAEHKIDLNVKSLEQFKKILVDLTTLTKVINSNYVTLDALNLYVRKKSSTRKANKQKQNLSKINGHNLVKKGEKLLAKKKYNEAIHIFQELLKRNYKASRSNYYLGEIYFYKKKYKKALVFYKKSVKIYSKSSFMPNLLLHAGISSSFIGDRRSAKKFFSSIVSSFPKTKEATKAKKHLKKLK